MFMTDTFLLCLTKSLYLGFSWFLPKKNGQWIPPHPSVGCTVSNTASDAEQAMLQTLIASYDYETYTHVHRIAPLAVAVAYHLHFSAKDLYLIYLAALLHDIGKSSIPQKILNKRGPLNHEEWEIVRLHPQIGQQVLNQLGGIFSLLAPVVVAHHERWDGLGYPYGLIGKEIPVAARILAVVDSYDAMTSFRIYQETLPVEEACGELQVCAGSKYDPHIVAAFLDVLKERRGVVA